MISKHFTRLLIALGMPLISACCGFADEPGSPGSVFYVAPWGNDGWSGKQPEANAAKTDGPLATLQRAREELRKLGSGQSRKEPLSRHRQP